MRTTLILTAAVIIVVLAGALLFWESEDGAGGLSPMRSDRTAPTLATAPPREKRDAETIQSEVVGRSVLVVEASGEAAVQAGVIHLRGEPLRGDWFSQGLQPTRDGYLHLAPVAGKMLFYSREGVRLIYLTDESSEVRLDRGVTLSVKVYDRPPGCDSVLATVDETEFTAQLNEEGEATLAVTPGDCLIRGETMSGMAASAQIHGAPGSSHVIHLRYEASRRFLVHTVGPYGEPAPRQPVRVMVDGRTVQTFTTNEEGRFEDLALPLGTTATLVAASMDGEPALRGSMTIFATKSRSPTVTIALQRATVVRFSADFSGVESNAASIAIQAHASPAKYSALDFAMPVEESLLTRETPQAEIALLPGGYRITCFPELIVLPKWHLSIEVGSKSLHVSIPILKPPVARVIRLVTGELPGPWDWRWSYRLRDEEQDVTGSGPITKGGGLITLPKSRTPASVSIVGRAHGEYLLAGRLRIDVNTPSVLDVRKHVRKCELVMESAPAVTRAWLFEKPLEDNPRPSGRVVWFRGYPNPITLVQDPVAARLSRGIRYPVVVSVEKNAAGRESVLVRVQAPPPKDAQYRLVVRLENLGSVSGAVAVVRPDGEEIELEFQSTGHVAQSLPFSPVTCRLARLAGLTVNAEDLDLGSISSPRGTITVRWMLAFEPFGAWPDEVGVEDAVGVRFLNGADALGALLGLMSADPTAIPIGDGRVVLTDSSGKESRPVAIERLLPVDLVGIPMGEEWK